jgi:hypothetical protein
LADYWTHEALREHASIAAFARFVLQCLSLGAPAELVTAAQAACAEETEHARIAFGLASAYAGALIEPGPLDITNALDGSELCRIAITTAQEGCIAETISSLIAHAAADAAEDPVVADALQRIAEQETAHALLAWRFLAWVLNDAGADLFTEIGAVFAAAERYVGVGPVTALAGDAVAMRAHGYLTAAERREMARQGLHAVVAPAFANLRSRMPFTTPKAPPSPPRASCRA